MSKQALVTSNEPRARRRASLLHHPKAAAKGRSGGRCRRIREGDEAPRLGPGQNGLGQGVVQGMATARRLIAAKDRRAEQRQIAEGVERLVANELVGPAQTAGI